MSEWHLGPLSYYNGPTMLRRGDWDINLVLGRLELRLGNHQIAGWWHGRRDGALTWGRNFLWWVRRTV